MRHSMFQWKFIPVITEPEANTQHRGRNDLEWNSFDFDTMFGPSLDTLLNFGTNFQVLDVLQIPHRISVELVPHRIYVNFWADFSSYILYTNEQIISRFHILVPSFIFIFSREYLDEEEKVELILVAMMLISICFSCYFIYFNC